ncbi:MAG: hypothetical protein WD069_13055 [Planctomycetales bacterium]
MERISSVALIVVSTAGAKPRPASLRDALVGAWHDVRALDHPLLTGAANVEPDFNQDDSGFASARLDFTNNAVWPAKRFPEAVDASRPYLWISVSLWRSGAPAQPSIRSRALQVGDKEYTVDTWVVSSDSMLAKRIETVLSSAFDDWYRDRPTLGPPPQAKRREK